MALAHSCRNERYKSQLASDEAYYLSSETSSDVSAASLVQNQVSLPLVHVPKLSTTRCKLG